MNLYQNKMENILWNKIEQFNFDNPISEYGFSTRLAFENKWTINFTQKAIIEYKKFMFLAAISEFMVSPSEIVDIVWHQHLIFTKSYNDLCEILEKKIEHIPSTHNKAEKDKFLQAKERTTKLYENSFGKQPDEIWCYESISDLLNLPFSKLNLRNLVTFAILLCLLFLFPVCYILKPIFSKLDSAYFLIGYVLLIVLTISFLEIYNRNYLKKLIDNLSANSTIKNLTPSELIYMKTGRLENVIHGFVNQLVVENILFVSSDNNITILKEKQMENSFENTIVDEIKNYKKINYPYILKKLISKPIFTQIVKSANEFDQGFKNSIPFIKLMTLNFFVTFSLFLIGLSRFIIGLYRHKPILLLFLILVGLLIYIIIFLKRKITDLIKVAIPNFYSENIVKSKEIKTNYENWEWQYFLVGTTFLSSSFVPAVHFTEKSRENNSFFGCGTSGSSCGNSCGSSCGGCGGD